MMKKNKKIFYLFIILMWCISAGMVFMFLIGVSFINNLVEAGVYIINLLILNYLIMEIIKQRGRS